MPMTLRPAIAAACLLLAGACAPGSLTERIFLAERHSAREALPPAARFPEAPAIASARSNADVARDFLDLNFRLETGHALGRLSRFEGPVSVFVGGDAPAGFAAEVDRLLRELRRGAGIDVARAEGGGADIAVLAVPGAAMRRDTPSLNCFVMPGVRSYREARMARSTGEEWEFEAERGPVAVFIPDDQPPHRTRSCLNEEIAQALGPLNDLYRLPGSVFNDDDVHSALTGFDMLVLRIQYAPELRSGMTREEVAARLPAILSRVNPQGGRVAPQLVQETPKPWIGAVKSALAPRTGSRRRVGFAREALRIARESGLSDHRLGYSQYVLGRTLERSDPDEARRHLRRAYATYADLPEADLHLAMVAARLARLAAAAGESDEALRLAEAHIGTARRHQDARLLGSLLLARSAALAARERRGDAAASLREALGWIRSGVGTERAVDTALAHGANGRLGDDT